MRSFRKVAIAVAAVSALSMTAACGADSADTETASGDTTASQSQSPMDTESSDAAMEGDSGMDPAANLVGPGCDDYAKAVPDGAGSVQGMAQDPVAVAASNNPLLKTLVASVSGELNPKVNLVDTLNGGEFTVFAPVDDAFAKIPADTIDTLAKEEGGKTLSSILTYHVIPKRIAPADIDGTFATVNGADLTITGSGDDIKVGDQASVICGGVQTANATVYLIDTVLMPPAA